MSQLISLILLVLCAQDSFAGLLRRPGADPFQEVDPPSQEVSSPSAAAASTPQEPERSRCGSLPDSDRLRKLSRELCPDSVRLAEGGSLGDAAPRAGRAVHFICFAPLHAVVQAQERICAGELRTTRRLSEAEHSREPLNSDSRLAMIQVAEIYTESSILAGRLAFSYGTASNTTDRWIANEITYGNVELVKIRELAVREDTSEALREAYNDFLQEIMQESRDVRSYIHREWYRHFTRMENLYNQQAQESQQGAARVCQDVANLGGENPGDCALRLVTKNVREHAHGRTESAPTGVAVRTAGDSTIPNTADPTVLTHANLENAQTMRMILGDPVVGDERDASTFRAVEMGERIAPSIVRVVEVQGSGFYVELPGGERQFVSVDHVTRTQNGVAEHTLVPEVYRQVLSSPNIDAGLQSMGASRADFHISLPASSTQVDPLLPEFDFSRSPASALSDPSLGGARPLRVGNVMDLSQGDAIYMVGYPAEARGDMVTVECSYNGMSERFELLANCPNGVRFPQGMSGGVWVNRDGQAIGATASTYLANSFEPSATTYQMQGTPLFVQQNIDELGRMTHNVGPVPRPPGVLFDGNRVMSTPCRDAWSVASGLDGRVQTCALEYRDGRYWRVTN